MCGKFYGTRCVDKVQTILHFHWWLICGFFQLKLPQRWNCYLATLCWVVAISLYKHLADEALCSLCARLYTPISNSICVCCLQICFGKILVPSALLLAKFISRNIKWMPGINTVEQWMGKSRMYWEEMFVFKRVSSSLWRGCSLPLPPG